MLKPNTHVLFALLLVCAFAGSAPAQVIVYDARLVGLGGGGGNSPNIALKMVPAATRAELVIPIPLGLIQTFKGGFDKFKPSSTGFDPLLAVETTGSALHYRFGADTGSTRTEFVNDLVNGTVNPAALSSATSGYLPRPRRLCSGISTSSPPWPRQSKRKVLGAWRSRPLGAAGCTPSGLIRATIMAAGTAPWWDPFRLDRIVFIA